jgi:signal transduction histidine kinase/CheY-like chemotaxis protein
VTISPIRDASGSVIGASKIVRDISNLKRMMREREELLANEQAARSEAERVSRMKDEFLATLSHELRTPLHAILGWSQLLRAPSTDAQELQQGLMTIERNARVQTQLIEELLDMSRIISGKVRLDVRNVDLVAVIEHAIESVRPAAEAKRIRLEKVLDPRAGPVTGDPNRLQQVMWNLLSNAMKFTPKGGRVQVFLQRVNSHVEITVSDTGQGIRADFLPHLFTRFTQADSSTTRAHGGLGLGLAIVRHLVELHGGAIKAKSAGEGKGATFIVALPLSVVHDERSEQEKAHPTAGHSMTASTVDLSGVKVLIVDDEPDACELVKHILALNHATVFTAESADEGLEILRQQRPHILISDVGMPGQDGYQFLARVRALGPLAGGQTPAVALTAFARPEDRRRVLMAGFQMHLPKPVDSAELVAVVANLTGRTAGTH